MSLQSIFKHLLGRHDQLLHNPHRRFLGERKLNEKIWGGRQHPTVGKKLSKNQVGRIGETLAIEVLSQHFGSQFETLNVGMNNAPIDIGSREQAIEVKTGLSSNGKSAQHWRATIGEPGKSEKDLIKQMSSEEKKKYNQIKRDRILERKARMLDDLSNISGKTVKGYTAGIILDPQGEKGDVYLFEGFHLRIGWNNLSAGRYLGSYQVK